MPAAEADQVLRALLASPHPAVVSALAWWISPEARSGEAIRGRLGRLPREVGVGELPSQAGADEWVAEHTLGLIDRFPIELDAETLMVLVSALATRVSWAEPFALVPSTELGGSGPWATSLNEVLVSRPWSHSVYLSASRVGLLGVHRVYATDGLEVYSVIGPPEVSAADLIAAWLSEPDRKACDLFELPVGDGHAWSLAEIEGQAGMTRTSAVLPAWTASSTVDLLSDPSFGVGEAMAILNAELPPSAQRAAARQIACAEYSRTGFAAAALTSQAIARGVPSRGPERHLTVRFNRPFAVFAYAVHYRGPRIEPLSPWHGLPVFSGWITEPTDATGT